MRTHKILTIIFVVVIIISTMLYCFGICKEISGGVVGSSIVAFLGFYVYYCYHRKNNLQKFYIKENAFLNKLYDAPILINPLDEKLFESYMFEKYNNLNKKRDYENSKRNVGRKAIKQLETKNPELFSLAFKSDNHEDKDFLIEDIINKGYATTKEEAENKIEKYLKKFEENSLKAINAYKRLNEDEILSLKELAFDMSFFTGDNEDISIIVRKNFEIYRQIKLSLDVIDDDSSKKAIFKELYEIQKVLYDIEFNENFANYKEKYRNEIDEKLEIIKNKTNFKEDISIRKNKDSSEMI